MSVKNQLNVMTTERNQIKERHELTLKSLTSLTKENYQLRMENMRLHLKPEPRRTSSSSFTKEMWRRFTQLCHTDRHSNSVAANEATRWLLENRP